MIDKILVALDGSEAADKALDYALDIACKYSANVLLLSVVQPVGVRVRVGAIPPIPPKVTVNFCKELREQHRSTFRSP